MVTVAFTGMFVACTTTGTADVELLIVASGKLKGLAFTGTPLMLVTVITGGGVVGRFNAKGSDVREGPELISPPALILLASRRYRPGCPLSLQAPAAPTT